MILKSIHSKFWPFLSLENRGLVWQTPFDNDLKTFDFCCSLTHRIYCHNLPIIFEKNYYYCNLL